MMKNNQNNNKERLGEYAASTVEQGKEKFQETKADLESQVKNAQDQLAKLTTQVDKQLRDNPWPYVVGVGLGCLLLGTLLGVFRRNTD
jgi:ElaB/YqjD/DUF883 family membrane-anchored ribosome-binding protein